MLLAMPGTILAVATIIALVVRFSIQKFIIDGEKWSMMYIQNYIEAFAIGVTVLVVAIPEGLPLAVTLALAYSVKVSDSSLRSSGIYLAFTWLVIPTTKMIPDDHTASQTLLCP